MTSDNLSHEGVGVVADRAVIMPDTPPEIAPPQPADRGGREAILAGLLGKSAVPIVLVVLFLVFSVLMPDTFATRANIVITISSNSVLLILALGLTVPLRAGDFDLSIAATMGFTAALVAVLGGQHHWHAGIVAVSALAAGLVIGAVNGFVVVFLEVNAFIATLAVMTILGGLTYAITGGTLVQNVPKALQTFSQDEWLGFPLEVWYGWGLALLLFYIYEFTPVGRYQLFVGGGRDIAALSGVPVRLIRFCSLAISGLLSGFAGLVLAGSLGAVDPSVSSAYLLPPYTAAFLGTTTILVGRFNIIGTVVGLYLIAVGVTGLELEGAASWISDVFDGVILLAAVIFAHFLSKLTRRARR